MRLLCNYLHTYYDTNILEYNSVVKEIFLDTIKKNKTDKKSNKTLIKLITNMKIPKQIKSRLTGPYTLSLHTSKKYKMNVYVFGEIHLDKDNIDIHSYLYNLLSSSGVFIDFFFEGFKLSEDNINNETKRSLSMIRNTVDPCVRKHSSCLALNSSRSHYFDIRPSNIDNKIDKMLTMLRFFYDSSYQQQFSFGILKEEYEILLEIIELDKNNVVDYIKQNFIEVKRLDKELSRTNPYIREILDKYILSEIDKLKDIRKISKGQIDSVFGKNRKDMTQEQLLICHDISDVIYDYLFHLGARLTDIYTLARLFKTFKVKIGENQPNRVHNAILYGGNNHSEIYRHILNQLKFNTVFNIQKNSDIFLSMENVKQPLFSLHSGVITNFDEK